MDLSKLFCASLLSTALLFADSRTGSFHMRTTAPVMVENTVLAPGSYVWTRMDSLANHNIVQISDEKTHRVTATIFGISSYREVATSQNEVDFWETPKGAPAAVRAWYSPGENYGQEFPYSPQLAMYRPTVMPGRFIERAAVPTDKPANANPQARQPADKGSWAVIGEGAPDASQTSHLANTAKPKHPGTIWDALSKLPLTATLAPLIGIIGIVSLGLYLLSYLKRKNSAA